MIELSGLFYRVMFSGAGDPTAPVKNPEGRFHHDNQTALYASQTVEGAVVATLTYVAADDPPREVHPLSLNLARVVDLTRSDAAARYGLEPMRASHRWQEDRAEGRPATTWALSDAARALGADGMLYASRKRPELAHIVLFRWNTPGGPVLRRAGEPISFAP